MRMFEKGDYMKPRDKKPGNRFAAHRILTYIESRHLTKQEFCRQCGIGISTLDRMLNGKSFRLDSFIKVVKLAELFF